MSKADDMFKELGYKIGHTQWGALRYKKDDDNVFIFNNTKSFHKTGEFDGMHEDITMQELQAINEKCKELQWI